MAAYDGDADADALAQRLATDGYALVADWLSADDAAHVRLEAKALAFEPSRVISGGRKVVDAERTDEICWLRGASGHPPALAGVAARLRALGRGLGRALARLDGRRGAPPAVAAALDRAVARARVRRQERRPATILADDGDGAAGAPPAMVARYADGARFTAHVDAANAGELPFGTPPDPRVLTAVVYASEPAGGWRPGHGGVLRVTRPLGAHSPGLDVLLPAGADPATLDVPPRRGLLVLFWSALVRHEVLPAFEERLALSMWYNEPPPRPTDACSKE